MKLFGDFGLVNEILLESRPLTVMSFDSYDGMYFFFAGFKYNCLLAVLGLSKPFLSL
jgi:hypothetical protein